MGLLETGLGACRSDSCSFMMEGAPCWTLAAAHHAPARLMELEGGLG